MQARIIAAASDDLTHRRRLWFVMPCGYPGGAGQPQAFTNRSRREPLRTRFRGAQRVERPKGS